MSTPTKKPARAIRVKNVDAKSAESRELHKALQDVVDQLNKHPAIATPQDSPVSSWASSLPIAVPIPLPKHLYPDNFVLPPNVVECDGRTISEARSILNGRTLDDLNGGGYFLRAGDTAGVVQADQVKNHGHSAGTFAAAAHKHRLAAGPGIGNLAVDNGSNGDVALGGFTSDTGPLAVAGTSGDPTVGGGTETRPKNVSHVFVIRLF